MKNECSIVQDILPLYVEEMVSDDTVSFVREHLKDCPRCRAELEKLQKPVEVQLKPDINAAPLKRLKKALLMKKLQTILCTVAILLALMLAVISLLTAPEYFEYTPDLVKLRFLSTAKSQIISSNILKTLTSAIQFISWKHGLLHGTECSKKTAHGL